HVPRGRDLRIHDLVEGQDVAGGQALGRAQVHRDQVPGARDHGVVVDVDDVAAGLAGGRGEAVDRGAAQDERHAHGLEGLQVVAQVYVGAGALDHGGGGVLLHQDH